MKPAQPRLDPVVIRAAARLLEEDPTISNLRMLQRLAHRFGPKLTQAVHVTRVERWVREPALLLIRTGALNGTGADLAAAESDEVAEESVVVGDGGGPGEGKKDLTPSSDAGHPPTRPPTPPPTPRSGRGGNSRIARDVEDALVEAFALGVDSGTPVEIVEAFRKVDVLRRELRARLAD